MSIGYIEGYYGRLLDWAQRKYMVEHGFRGATDTSFWLYAPKEDALHRQQWRTPYPSEWLNDWQDFCTFSQSRNVQPIMALSPGHCSPQADNRAFIDKAKSLMNSNSTTLAILFDDVEDWQNADANLANSQAEMIVEATSALDLEHVIVCPTIYSDQLAAKAESSQDYLAGFCRQLPDVAKIMWTGRRIMSPVLAELDTFMIKRYWSHEIIIWDNFFANDYQPDLLGLYVDQYRNLPQQAVWQNATGLPRTDALYLQHQILCASQPNANSPDSPGSPDSIDSIAIWQQLLLDNDVPKAMLEVASMFSLPCDTQLQAVSLSDSDRTQAMADLGDLLFSWQHPLKLEWFTALNCKRKSLLRQQ